MAVENPVTEVLFYHLEQQPLDRVLPMLLEKTLERGWNGVVRAGNQERLEALDNALWTYSDESFLPHATAKDGNSELQPIYLTTGEEIPNSAGVLFLVDGADTDDFKSFVRVVHLFDGHDGDAVALARRQWKAAKAADCTVTYWQQNQQGRWEKKA